MASLKLQNKELIAALGKDMYKATPESIEATVKKYYAEDVAFYGCHPFNELAGIEAVTETFYKPMMKAFPDMSKDTYITMAGSYNDGDWVSITGNMVGTFMESWLDIPANNQATWIRFGEFYKIVDGKIVEARIILDLLDVMRQAGFRFIPSLAPEIIIPGPASYDGNLLYETDDETSAAALDLVESMIYKGLKKASQGLEKQKLNSYWSDDFMWYGPAGIGSTKGLKGFKDYHQEPFLVALPDRVGGHNHSARFGDGNYICSTGWPSVEATHTGAGWLGIPAPNKKISMRVMDWWRSDGEYLVENWVFIDIIEYLLQLDIDVFDRLKKRKYLI